MDEEFDIIIEPNKSIKKYWKEIWDYRELLYFLSLRDFLVRYKQTAIGVAWAIIRPLIIMIIFTIVFGKIAKLPSDNIPYSLLVFSGMIPWQLFSSIISEASSSVISNANMITKVYFPRLIIPLSTVLVCLIDFLISFSILIILMFWYEYLPSLKILLLPVLILLTIFCSLGFGIWLSALNTKYKDFKHLIPFLIQFGLYISPVGFKSEIISNKWIILYSLNPMTGIIESFRYILLDKYSQYLPIQLTLSIIISTIFIITGTIYFRKIERSFADFI
ncbi:MAG: transport permease protein [Candidatus Sericytochromatia bacterium]|nr:MAG: transport permease protein [Candidatus Sericytochromatia bacterium]